MISYHMLLLLTIINHHEMGHVMTGRLRASPPRTDPTVVEKSRGDDFVASLQRADQHQLL